MVGFESGRIAESASGNDATPHLAVLRHTDEILTHRDHLLHDTDEVLDGIDETLKTEAAQTGFYVRHPAVPANMLGVSFINPRTLGSEGGLWLLAMSVESERGAQGFNPNTVKYVYKDDGRLSVAALQHVIRNYMQWRETSVEDTVPRGWH